jgi:hypothetical protein
MYWRIVLFGGVGKFVEFAVESNQVAGPLADARGSVRDIAGRGVYRFGHLGNHRANLLYVGSYIVNPSAELIGGKEHAIDASDDGATGTDNRRSQCTIHKANSPAQAPRC